MCPTVSAVEMPDAVTVYDTSVPVRMKVAEPVAALVTRGTSLAPVSVATYVAVRDEVAPPPSHGAAAIDARRTPQMTRWRARSMLPPRATGIAQPANQLTAARR